MHFLIHRDLRQNRTVRRLLIGYLACILVFLTLQPVFENAQIGLLPDAISLNVLGSETAYREPMALADLVTNIHIKLFLHAVIGLILASVVTRAGRERRAKTLAIAALFLLPVAEAASLLAVFYLGAWWSYAKAAAFGGLWLNQVGLSLYLLAYLRRPPP